MADNQYSTMRAARDLQGAKNMPPRSSRVVTPTQLPAPESGPAPRSLMQGRDALQAPPPPAPTAPAAEPAPVEQPEQIERVSTIDGVARNARDMTRRLSGPITAEEPASEEEQAEYQRATDALSRVLYEDEKTSAAVIGSLVPEDKVGSVAQAALLVISQLDDQLDLDESVMSQLTIDVVDRLVDLGEQTKNMQFSDEEVQSALGATWEGILQKYGTGEAADFEEATQGMTDDELKSHTQSYRQFLGGDF